jgi:osomolarity two-component system sensor histidine kinase SLN1
LFEWEVADTGPGMAEHVQEKVFEPFFQGDMALSKKFQGTGLGLSICAQLAALMSGSMGLKSQEGVGSTFTMRVPLKQIGTRTDSSASSQAAGSVRFNSPRNSISGEAFRPADGRFSLDAPGRADDDSRSIRSFTSFSEVRSSGTPPPSTPSSSAPKSAAGSKDSNGTSDHSRSLKILVAEDNKTNQVVVQRLLKMESVTDVTIAVNGKVAYDMVIENMAKTDNFDLIFMDVQVSIPNLPQRILNNRSNTCS